MKIAFFTDTYLPQVSGVATSIRILSEELQAVGHHVYIFTTTDPQAKESTEQIMRLPSIPFVSFKDRRIVVSGLLDAYERAKQLDLDLIHTHTEFGTGLLGKQIGKLLDIPVVHTYHTMYEDYLHYIAKGKIIRPSHVKQATRAYCRHLSGIICPSQRVVDKLTEYEVISPLSIIPTGIQLQQFEEVRVSEARYKVRQKWGMSEQTTLLLSLSRLSYEKNIQAVLKALPKIVEKQPDTCLMICGKGPYQEELEQLVHSLSLRDYVLFTGEIQPEEVAKYYRAADIFVNASTSESQGLTYIEALAARIPMVVKTSPYVASLMRDESLGRLFEDESTLSAQVLDVIALKLEPSESVVQEILTEISSQTFARRVLEFYESAISYHHYFIKKNKTMKKARVPSEKDLSQMTDEHESMLKANLWFQKMRKHK